MENHINPDKIKSLTGIKVFALLLIFYQHSSLPLLPFGLGSRMCELLMIISGFLVGYNYYYKNVPCSWKESFRYCISKLISIYPLYILITIIRCVIEYKSFNSVTTWIKLLLTIFMVQPWSPNQDVFFAFNGSSWFIICLLYSYFLSPLFLRLIHLKNNFCIFLLTIFIRVFLELIDVYSNVSFVEFSFHVNPFIRSLEFFLGMLLVPYFYNIKERIKNISRVKRKIYFTFLEILILMLSIFYLTICLILYQKALTFDKCWVMNDIILKFIYIFICFILLIGICCVYRSIFKNIFTNLFIRMLRNIKIFFWGGEFV